MRREEEIKKLHHVLILQKKIFDKSVRNMRQIIAKIEELEKERPKLRAVK